MKVVVASTPTQENHIQELVNSFYTDIFPRFFTDKEIEKFREFEIMSFHNVEEHYNGTLKEAFQLISSMQALIAVLETIHHRPITEDNRIIFEKNVRILQKYGFCFPFHFDHFLPERKSVVIPVSKLFDQALI